MPNQSTSAYLPNLTPLRGMAALVVLLFHFDLYWGGPSVGSLVPTDVSLLIKKGYVQVDFFFVLSGFIMSYAYGNWFGASVSKKHFLLFMKARFARIYPLHLFTLALSVLLYEGIVWTEFPMSEGEKSVFSLWALPVNLALAHGLGMFPVYTWNGPSWTISVEWWMYVLFPFLYGFAARASQRGRLIGLAGLLAGYCLLVYGWNTSASYPWSYFLNVSPYKGGAFVRCFLGFSLGVVFHGFYHRQWGRGWLANGYAPLGLAVVMAASMHLGLSDLITVATFPFLILSMAYGSRTVNALLALKPMQWLGRLSFSIYLTNELIFDTGRVLRFALGFTDKPLQTSLFETWLWCIGWILVVLLIASLTYRFIEVPARQRINQWGNPPVSAVASRVKDVPVPENEQKR